ncbi:DUF3526 domain-containing protein [Paraflavitalea pollutisoli]|uniref:DUF3526 domain-containing protein n=1 Tax=Paraflavitalea pollutisoli TaxID=3034143 RepID=UPI0023EDC75D|nr:DUF3526 domain-containing protein [Paraflavitalea sp. H1-2-19X]
MNLFAALFRLEWFRLVRSRLLLISLIAFTAIAAGAIHTGRVAMQVRGQQLDSIRNAYQRDFQAQWQLINDTTPAGKAKAGSAGIAAVVNFRLPQNALWQPRSLQTLSGGISDVQPFYYAVQTTTNYTEPPNIPVSNPVRLFAGNFDLAFVWLYLLPLLIIAYGYPLYAEEQERGTAALLSIQGRSLRRIIAVKLLFRITLISVLVAGINVAGFIASPGQLTTAEVVAWLSVTQGYILLWAAIVWLIVSLRTGSTLAALLLTATWLVTTIVAPAVSNIYVAARYPVPLRSELASLQRHESEQIWSMPPRVLVDSFNAAHPQYAGSSNPAKDTVGISTRFVAGYYYLLEKRVQRAAITQERELTQRNQYFAQMAAINPVLHTQQQYNQLAGSGFDDYQHYRRQVAAFQQQWKGFLYPFQLADQRLGTAEFQSFPVFNEARAIGNTGITYGLYILIAVTMAAGYVLFNRKKAI